MTISMGINVKVTAANLHRAAWRGLFEALGLKVISAEASEVAQLDDGGHFGVFFVDASETIPEELAARAPWLELRVSDLADATRALDAIETPRHAYSEQAHPYFVAPGGLIFRLARLG